MHLYLIRHGQSFVNLSDWDWNSGVTVDQPLTELGERQAALLAAWLPSRLSTIAALYASTMQRARQTAAPLAHAYGCAIHFEDRVREIGNNRFDHTAWSAEEMPNRYANYWATARPFSPTMHEAEASETYMHSRVRVGLFLEEIVHCHRDQNVLVVCHGGVIDCVFDHVFNVGPWRRCEMWTNNTAVSHFEYMDHPGREVWRLHYYNRVDHLPSADLVS
jgi:probable phosphoglycerate mutase